MPSSRFTVRSPDIFPILFADRVQAASLLSTPQVLRQHSTHAEARAFLNIFRDWRYCLRTWPGGGRCADIENGPERIHSWIEPADDVWLTMVEVRGDFRTSLVELNAETLSTVI